MAADSPELVLSTLRKDGSRRWLNPKLSVGRFWKWRRIVAWSLLILYNVLPWIQVGGEQALLLDVMERKFVFFGLILRPTDSVLFMLVMAAVFVTIFLVTALFGRLWCGWACPQTVYLEFVFRPIERLFLGKTPSARKKNASTMPLRRVAMYVAYFIIAFHLANTFLSYFVGARIVFEWTLGSPLNHVGPFLLVLFVTAMILLDFGFFREQICIVCCPYGRMQSVMLDKNSMIISYDESRGEPRGMQKRSKKNAAAGEDTVTEKGDCIDCTLCVQTCPTGIDIREGLQMECIGCAQCIDACDAVMDKVGTPRGLIRYTSQEALETGKKSILRPRVIIYPVILAIICTLLIVTLVGRPAADVKLVRASGRTFVTLPNGDISNEVGIKIVNRTDAERSYSIEVSGLNSATLEVNGGPVVLAPNEMQTRTASIEVDANEFRNGRANCEIIVSDDAGFSTSKSWRLQGPWGSPKPSSTSREN